MTHRLAFSLSLAIILSATAPALAQGAGQGRTPPTPEQRAARFAAADTNADSALSKAEFTAFLPERQKARVDAIWSNLDANADGKLSKEEFLAMPARRRGQGQ
jgi:hypothetical protein